MVTYHHEVENGGSSKFHPSAYVYSSHAIENTNSNVYLLRLSSESLLKYLQNRDSAASRVALSIFNHKTETLLISYQCQGSSCLVKEEPRHLNFTPISPLLVPHDDDIKAVVFSWSLRGMIKMFVECMTRQLYYHDHIAIVGGNRGNPHSDDFIQTSFTLSFLFLLDGGHRTATTDEDHLGVMGWRSMTLLLRSSPFDPFTCVVSLLIYIALSLSISLSLSTSLTCLTSSMKESSLQARPLTGAPGATAPGPCGTDKPCVSVAITFLNSTTAASPPALADASDQNVNNQGYSGN
ncbi:hypothetical protein ACFE04_023463 [Oxalis oulophora]